MDAVREDTAVVEVTGEDAEDRTNREMENPLWYPLTGEAKMRRCSCQLSASDGVVFRLTCFAG